jgi:hypothetical protein
VRLGTGQQLGSRARLWRLHTLGGLWLAACGSRTEPVVVALPPALVIGGSSIECVVDSDCESSDLCSPRHCEKSVCVDAPIVCDDNDACSQDRCDPRTGLCDFVPVTIDADGDGYLRPLPGFLPGAPGSCGDDCNDASAAANPGGLERCDGIDNDCDGIVDIGSTFTPSDAPALLLSSGAKQGTPGGLTFSDSAGTYGAVFTQRIVSSQNSFTSLRSGQLTLGPVVVVPEVNSDTFAGPIVGRDTVFATAWEDRRDEDYEIYFNRLNTRGEKLGPDVRVTNAPGFSLRPTLVELPSARGQEYRLAWEDERDGDGGHIFGQRLSGAGELVDGNLDLTPVGIDPSSPLLVAGQQRLGLLFNQAAEERRALAFMSFDLDFGSPSERVLLPAQNPDGASMVANAGRFVVAWHVVEDSALPGPQIWGSVLSETGELLVNPKPLTEPAQYARYHSLLPLGDRLLLLWSEWRSDKYEIYSRELSPELDALGRERLISGSSLEAYAPLAAFGPSGEIGVMFTGHGVESTQPQVFFTHLSCDTAAQVPAPR